MHASILRTLTAAGPAFTALASTAATTSVGSDVPVQPDGDQARQWATEELGKAVYQEAKPSWPEQLLGAILEWLGDLLQGLRGVNADVGVVVIVIAGAAVIGTAIWLAHPRTNRSAAVRQGVFDGGGLSTAVEHRGAARRAADRGQFGEAVLEQFRAIVRSAEERTIIEVQPGRTAGEVTGQLCTAFVGLAPVLLTAGELFNSVRYGNATPQPEDFAALLSLDRQLQLQHPDHEIGAEEPWERVQ